MASLSIRVWSRHGSIFLTVPHTYATDYQCLFLLRSNNEVKYPHIRQFGNEYLCLFLFLGGPSAKTQDSYSVQSNEQQRVQSTNKQTTPALWQCLFGLWQVALGDRFWLFIQTLNNDKKPFNSIFNSKIKSNYSFKEFIHSKTKSNYSFKELFIQNGQNNPAWENS